MRPTDLQFRSPKEETPGPYNPAVTADGRALKFTPRASQPAKLKASFSSQRRFEQYDQIARRTGCLIGPGVYSTPKSAFAQTSLRGGPLYKPYMGKNVKDGSGYFYSNGHLVYHESQDIRRPRRANSVRRLSRTSNSDLARPQSSYSSRMKESPYQEGAERVRRSLEKEKFYDLY